MNDEIKETLRKLYIDDRFSEFKIADITGFSRSKVHRLLVKFDIPRRPACRKGTHKSWRKYTKGGYVQIGLKPDDFFYPMVDKDGYVREHRLVMAQHLGRCLHPWEKVHHKDGIKDHNEYSNLKMTTAGSHIIEHSKGYRDGYLKGLYDGHEARIEQLEARVTLLEAENVALKVEQTTI